MPIKPWYDVWCDFKGCMEWVTGGRNRKAAADNAVAEGWTNKQRAGWRCPEHQGASRRSA